VVTFDDGYADNLQVVEPLPRAAGVPATALVVSGGLDVGRTFWWGEVEALRPHEGGSGGDNPDGTRAPVRAAAGDG
jgi:peptidoglycan/xylan/chitin deacetylase (PgdA/CDA1 family)